MFVSDIKRKRLIRVFLYVFVAVFCVLFSQVYGLFSHGVTSFFMTYLFLPPLFGWGTELLLFFCAPRRFRRIGDNLFHAGIATATVGFLLQGIFEIAGTDSPYMIVFVVTAPLLLLGAVVDFLRPEGREREGDHETSVGGR
ncbi:MAG: hypothetical protein J6C26_10525 [Clostridia bacterium]|nr:hypothetical protein [Clostridia bacterium]